MNWETLTSLSRCGLAEKHQLVRAFGLQRSEKPLHVCIQIRTSRCQANGLNALGALEVPKRLTVRRVAVPDQIRFIIEETVLMVGEFEGNRIHTLFIRIRGAACKLDAASFQLHHKQQIESSQSAPGP